ARPSRPRRGDPVTLTSTAPIRRRALHDGWPMSIPHGPAPFPRHDVPATVPGTRTPALQPAGLTAAPYLDPTERELAWTGDCDVLYSTSFDWQPSGADRIDLVAESLDTAATVVLNGRRIAEVQNQHRSWRFDVTDSLVEGSNRLQIHFASPLRTARE